MTITLLRSMKNLYYQLIHNKNDIFDIINPFRPFYYRHNSLKISKQAETFCVSELLRR